MSDILTFEELIKDKVAINAGCGENKIKGCINCDVEPACNPDEVVDFTKRTKFADNSVDFIFLIHVIEHIEKWKHPLLFWEFHRILKEDGKIVIAFPEFTKIAKCWIDNYRGQREFFEHTIYGLQRYPSDYHVALMDSVEFKDFLQDIGFKDVEVREESKHEFYNTVVRATKGIPTRIYEQVIAQDIFGVPV